MTNHITLLDHGYVQLVEHWGSDERIIEAARMSTNKGFQGWESDERLLAYLYRNKHATPFEMCGVVIEVQAPIFVFREWHRHRTQSYNELSARYTPLPNLNYCPTPERILTGIADAGANKQAQGTGHVPTEHEAMEWIVKLSNVYEKLQLVYSEGLEMGIPKEIARLPVPVARYSRMRASANLRNWLAFLTLRMAPNAQWEIRQYANAVAQIVAELFPRTWRLFESGKAEVGSRK